MQPLLDENEKSLVKDDPIQQMDNSSSNVEEKKDDHKEEVPVKSTSDNTDVTSSYIEFVMEHISCTRQQAIDALVASKDDPVNAVIRLIK